MTLPRFAKAAVFWVVLRPLILRNYRLREQGKLPDEWYWADRRAFLWGYTIEPPVAETPAKALEG